ncbi:hypothetical protein [Ralstonia sp. Ralssp135]|uniref:hypothetical protein n=1 Tax=Ralstonia sp. Ralssp135 TaxID=3243016 RepID=UPI0039B0E931
MSMVKLYAWTTPAFFKDSIVDHTWVTAYDNRVTPYSSIDAVVEASSDYWYSWGSFHPAGTALIAQGTASLEAATYLCEPNADSRNDRAAAGTIFVYGIDGVCHQLANQILWSTGSATQAPRTVELARGYHVSSALYGTYGLNKDDWIQHRDGAPQAANVSLTYALPIDNGDDFERHARAVLAGSGGSAKLASLLAYRKQHARETLKTKSDVKLAQVIPTADSINARVNEFLGGALGILGPDDFKRVFQIDPLPNMNLVDPDLFAQTTAVQKPANQP